MFKNLFESPLSRLADELSLDPYFFDPIAGQRQLHHLRVLKYHEDGFFPEHQDMNFLTFLHSPAREKEKGLKLYTPDGRVIEADGDPGKVKVIVAKLLEQLGK
jgi:isopenicillin N synthase-like dioxygenase